MPSLSRRIVLGALGVAIALGLIGHAGGEPAAGRRYLLHVSGMT